MAFPATQSNRSQQDGTQLRTPPQSLEMERALLGAMLLDGKAFPRIGHLIDATSFYRPAHGIIFSAMRELDSRYEAIDLVTVTEELKREEKLEQIGGSVALADLAEAVPSAANIEHYARIVHEKAVLRKLVSLGIESSNDAYEPAARADEVLEGLQSRLVDLIGDRRGQHSVSASDAMHQTMAYVEHMKSREGFLTGIGSGFDRLDDFTTGFSPGELVIVAARPSMGKTTLAMDMAKAAAAKYDKPVAIFSLEMEVRQLVMRMLSGEAHIPLQNLRTGRLKKDDYIRLSTAAAKLAELPLYFDDQPGLEIGTLRARARQLWMEHDIGMIVIDYLQLIQPPVMADNQQQFVAYLSASLKNLAKELKVPVVCLSQLSRAPETRGGDRRPLLSDLRDSGAIEQDADIVMFVYRPEMYKDFIKGKNYEVAGTEYPIEGLAEVIVAKNRNGPTGSVPLTFIGKLTTFQPITMEAPPVTAGDEETESGEFEDDSQPF